MTVGGVLRETWLLYRRLFVASVAVSASVFAVTGLVQAALPSNTNLAVAVTLAAVAVTFAASLLVQGALSEAVRDLHDGRATASASALYGRTKPRLGTLLASSLLAGLGVGLGLLLLVVPGAVLFTRWALIVPVIVYEELPTRAAFRRSRELVRGHGWTVFGTLFAIGLATLAIAGALQLVLQPLPRFASAWLGALLAGALLTPYQAHALSVMYYRLTEPDRATVAAGSLAPRSLWREHSAVRPAPSD